MASINLRAAVSQPSLNHRRRIIHRKIPSQISLTMKSPQIRSNRHLTTKSPIISHSLDDWVHDSAAEIVRNLRRAPLLVQVHESGGERRVETEAAAAEGWKEVASRWRDGEAPAPDGVMLVEELGGEGEGEDKERDTRAWGIVVQGKGSDCGPRCYLLKTSQVGSGLGTCCTHFCLTRVRDFRESALSQLNSCWLLN